MSILLIQILVGSMNMVTGILAVTYYALYVAPSGGVSAPGTLLPIALFAFIFGVLSFTLACLGAVPAFNFRLPEPQLSEPPRMDYERYSPQVSTREYVTERRQTVAEQTIVGLACPNCSRMVSREDNFCDLCGARFKETVQRPEEIPVEGVEKS
jgi:hypothetical protein